MINIGRSIVALKYCVAQNMTNSFPIWWPQIVIFYFPDVLVNWLTCLYIFLVCVFRYFYPFKKVTLCGLILVMRWKFNVTLIKLKKPSFVFVFLSRKKICVWLVY
jgi:hypothetical protein